jgi:hypothetical protein
MGNVQSGSEARKDPKSLRQAGSEQHVDKNPHSPSSPTTIESQDLITTTLPSGPPDAPSAKDLRSQQDVRQILTSELLAPVDTLSSKQNDFGDKGIDLQTAISLLQQLKRTASPGDLIALRNCDHHSNALHQS